MSSTEAPLAESVSEAAAQGLLFDGDFSALPADHGFRGPIACSAAGITYRQLDYWARTGLGRAGDPVGHRVGNPAAVQLSGHLDPQGDQAAPGRRDLAAADPGRHRPPPGARCRGPHRDHVDERWGLGLRMHLRRRGHRPAPRRAGRLRHRPRRGVARHRGHAWPSCRPSRWPRRPVRIRGPSRAATSCRCAGAPARRDRRRPAANAVRERPADSRASPSGAEGATSPEPLRQPEPYGDGNSGAAGDRGGARDLHARACANL